MAHHALLAIGRGAPAYADSVPWLCLALVGADAVKVAARPDQEPGSFPKAKGPHSNRIVAAWALERVAVRNPAILPDLAGRPSPTVRRLAIRATASRLSRDRTSNAELRRLPREALNDPDGSVRAEACRALKAGKDRDALDLLEGLIADPDPRVRSAAATALGSLATTHASPPSHRLAEALVDRLMDEDDPAGPDVLAALRQLREVPVDRWLAEAREGERGRRIAVLRALATRADSGVAEALAALLEDPSRDVRRHVSRSLAGVARAGYARLLPHDVVGRILSHLQSESSETTVSSLLEAVAYGAGPERGPDLLRLVPVLPGAIADQAIDAAAILELRSRRPRAATPRP